ncbi:ParB/RepB/Spo0J family partition protein [Vibrio fluvialis]|uniref:ParB/RepB/Spo0J family partition protein n=1 Tax=Vibrio fluvialis TaxID=676 RepID=UPI0023AA1034|nr:hypothetical protein [Vibrio fluvialis]MDE5179222.1 hypothetical protein [Vibrio fluvialis]
MTNQVNASQLTFFSATPKTLSGKVEGSKRPEQLKAPFSKFLIMDGWNIRKEINEEHVDNLVTAFSHGQEPSDFLAQPVELNGEIFFAVLGGHHSHRAVAKMIEKGIKYTNDSVFGIKLVKADNEADRIVQAYNHNQGLDMTYLDKARTFQSLRAENVSVTEIANRLGVKKSVVSNALYLLNGDAELLNLVETKQISGTNAMHLLREHGPEKATQYAKASIGIFDEVQTESTGGDVLNVTADNDEQLQLPELESVTQLSAPTVESNQEPTQAELSRSAAKLHKRTPKKKDDLTPSEKQQLYSLYLMLAAKSSTLDLPDAVQHEVDKMVSTIKEKTSVTQS